MTTHVSECQKCRHPLVKDKLVRLHLDHNGQVVLGLKLEERDVEALTELWADSFWFFRRFYQLVGGGTSELNAQMYYYNRIEEAEQVLGADRVGLLYERAKESVESSFPDADAFYSGSNAEETTEDVPF